MSVSKFTFEHQLYSAFYAQLYLEYDLLIVVTLLETDVVAMSATASVMYWQCIEHRF